MIGLSMCKHGSSPLYCLVCDMERNHDKYKWVPFWEHKEDNQTMYVRFDTGHVYKGRYSKHGQDVVFDRVINGKMLEWSTGELA